EYIEPEEMAKSIFDGRPVMRQEFMEKIEDANVPEKVEMNSYVTKKIGSNVKLSTDIGVELSFPAEYYRDGKYIDIINNEDGTISIQINNIGELINK
ncbi:MAG: nucleoid-associated protein, partial [Oscillospiraceae bacterium]|nr:nucleoid-associated protein [Oscillospiraceae bacterium]